MRAMVMTAFHGLADDKPGSQDFDAGKEIEGNLAWYAVQAGFAEWTARPNEAEAHAMRTSPAPAVPPRPVGKPRKAKDGAGDDGKGGKEGEGGGKLV